LSRGQNRIHYILPSSNPLAVLHTAINTPYVRGHYIMAIQGAGSPTREQAIRTQRYREPSDNLGRREKDRPIELPNTRGNKAR